VGAVVPLFALDMTGEIVSDGGFVGKILFGFLVAVSVNGVGFGQVMTPAAPPPSTVSAVSQGGAGKTMLLWPEGAPGALGDEDVDKPTLTVFLPVAPNPTKTGVVVAPGGGYTHLAVEKEGYAFARWLNERGVAAFVLQYRLGPKYHYPVELEDAQRAIRMVRAHAAEYGVATDHVGMWGSSAGGHLAATAGTRFDAGKADASEVVERQGSRPDFLILSYPVITFHEPDVHRGSLKYLLGDSPDPSLVDSLSAETQVTTQTPPTFLFATSDDKTVPVINSDVLFGAGEGWSAGGDASVSAWGAWSGIGGWESSVEWMAGSAGEVDAGAWVYGGCFAVGGGG
jgi:acetyl esterase/lipase